MINLQDITLCIVDCKNYNEAAASIIYCSNHCNINFGKKIFVSDFEHEKLKKYEIDFIKIDKINDVNEYSNFIIKQIYKYIETKYMLIIQHDGFIYKSDKWTNDFLKYDYIGAPWHTPPVSISNSLVGNGGFSLRSKNLMIEVSSIIGNNITNSPEDVYISCINREYLEKNGFIFASPNVAANFSTEQSTRDTFSIDYESFGFHLVKGSPINKHVNHRNQVYENIYKNW